MSEQLIRKRGSLKASLTNFVKFVETKSTEQALGDTDVIQIRERLTHMEIVHRQFDEIQTEIEAVIDEAKLSEQYTERSNFDESYFKIISSAKNMLAKFESKNDDILSVHSNRSVVSSHSTAASAFYAKGIKLPTISLPKYKGSYEDWLEFRETFESLVHENETLTPIQRYHYLRAALDGDAALLIKSIEFTSAGYAVAWQALCDRYNDPKSLVHNHIKAIFSIEGMTRPSSSKIRTLVDDFSKHLKSIEQLKQNITNWDPLLIFIIGSKLDSKTLSEWEKYSTDLAIEELTIDRLKQFLKNQANLLEKIESRTGVKSGYEDKYSKRENKYTSRALISSVISCYYCKKNHPIYICDEFKGLSIDDRNKFAVEAKLCLNCLRDNHPTKRCKMGPCMKCRRWHNTLLHPEELEHSTGPDSSQVKAEQVTTTLSSGVEKQGPRHVLLSTARVKIFDRQGKPHIARVLLDSGSQSCFITNKMCDKLDIQRSSAKLNVLGISNTKSEVKEKCEIKIHSLCTSFSANITCFILPEITSLTPGFKVDVKALRIPSDIQLSDVTFGIPGPIDLLIGIELFWTLLRPRNKDYGKYNPILQDTELGWIVSGPVGDACVQRSRVTSCNLSTNQELLHTLSKFWEIEEFGTSTPPSEDEIECERIFAETTRRDQDGRFIVTLPLKRTADCLGKSKEHAERLFYSTERKLQNNDKLRELYVSFMKEYESLNHMTVGNEGGIEYYMPHHGVLRENSLTTKLRVVFNASYPSSSGISLNDIQRVGPVLQDDLLSIVLRFRQHRYVVSADCSKMYRQVLVEPSQRSLQKILWRADPTDKLNTYTLNTVTYGHASASYLAIRCLFELANQCEELKPEIAAIIRHDFYVDDLLTGTETIEHAQYICHEVSQILKGGCFELRKWCSNEPKVLQNIKDTGLACTVLELGPNENTKALGLSWSCQDDKLLYKIENISNDRKCTKRSILSLVSRIYDPLGLLSPVIVIAKILLQSLWSEKLSWDDALPESLVSRWTRFTSELSKLNELTVDRHVICKGATNVDLHGFADASERAYGACLFIRSVDSEENVHVNLLCAKSKVAPIKTLSVPRLELCAALLLSRLTDKVIKSMTIKYRKCVLWSDSAITLAWIKTSPNLLKAFIANRVAEIQSLTRSYEWRYTPTHDNPADHLSRGLYPDQILSSYSWWHGSQWLKLSSSEWPLLEHKVDSLPEMKSQVFVAVPIVSNTFPFERFSSFSRLIRATAYVLRFKANCQRLKDDRIKTPLTLSELNCAKRCLVKAAQDQSFHDEINKLREGKLSPKDKLSSLTPYLDCDYIIRVGGRLELSEFAVDKRHPILLHADHQFTKLIFAYEHLRLMHIGPQGLLSSIRNEYWPIRGRNLARATVKKCVRCFRFKPSFTQPIMGNLPRERTVPSPPFSVTGVDFAGPFSIRRTLKRSRDNKTEKCYVALFICFATKALHLELVSSLSTDAFLQALRRFISRRGKPTKIVSDNGLNFVGADRELKRLLKTATNDLASTATDHGIDWQFIPPYSPHMGGLWEAGVKSVKYHLKRVLGNALLTFEEFYTMLTQVESILNSRPLCPLTQDPNDLGSLTPAHFLVGRSLIAAPDADVTDIKLNRLSRFELVQRLSQHFWKRWKQDYIAELQQRQKWKFNRDHLSEGMLVLLKNDQTLPTNWPLGRVIKVHYGADGIPRVATIKTRSGVTKRSFPKICPLPIEA